MQNTALRPLCGKLATACLALIVALGLSPLATVATVETAYAGTVNTIAGSSDGTNVTITFNIDTGKYYDETVISVTYADGSSEQYKLQSWPDSGRAELHNLNGWTELSGSSISLATTMAAAFAFALLMMTE